LPHFAERAPGAAAFDEALMRVDQLVVASGQPVLLR
jgi:hypothetical protein